MKKLIYSISEKTKSGEYKKVFSISRMNSLGMLNQNLTDGEYPFIIKSTLLFNEASELPSHPQVKYQTQDNKMVDMKGDMIEYKTTWQIVKGVLRIKNGRLDTKHLDKQIPSVYSSYNNHIFLERMWVHQNGVIELSMGS